MSKKRLLSTIKIISTLVVMYFVFQYIETNYNKVNFSLRLNIFLLLSLIFLLAGKVMLSWGATRCVSAMEKEISFHKIFWIYSLSQLAKYVPGSVWQFVGRGYAYKDEGLSSAEAFKTIVSENIFLVLGVVSVACTSLFFNLEYVFLRYVVIVLIGLIVIWVLFGSAWINRINIIELKVLEELDSTRVERIKIFAVYVSVWVVIGLSYYFLLLSLGFEVPWVIALGSFSFAWVAGFFSIFVPGGIGVREGILIYFLLPFMTEQDAFTVSIISRLIWIFVEVFIVILFFVYRKLYGLVKSNVVSGS